MIRPYLFHPIKEFHEIALFSVVKVRSMQTAKQFFPKGIYSKEITLLDPQIDTIPPVICPNLAFLVLIVTLRRVKHGEELLCKKCIRGWCRGLK